MFAAAAAVIVWFALFRNHTKIHAWFMVRFLYIPLALGWSSLAYVAFAKRLPTMESTEQPE